MSIAQRRIFTVSLLVLMAFTAFIQNLRGSLLTDIIDYYSLTNSQQGLPSSMTTLGAMLAMLLTLGLIGRIKKPILLLISIGSVLILLIPQYAKPAYAVFVAINLLFGVGMGVIDTLMSSLMADAQKGKKAALMMCMLHASYGIGGILSPKIFAALLSNGVMWNYVYLIVAVAGAVLLILVTPTAIKQSRVEETSGNGTKLSAGVLKEFFSDRTLTSLTLVMLFFGLFCGGLFTWTIRFVNTEYSSTLGDTALSLVFVGITASRLITPLIKIKPMTCLKWSGILAWIILTTALFIKSDIATCVMMCVSLVLCGSTIPLSISSGCTRWKGDSAIASTILCLSMYIGQTICTPLIGAIEARAGLSWGMAVCYAFVAVSSLCVMIGVRNER